MARITHYKKEWLKDIVFITKPLSKVELTVASSVSEKNYFAPTEPGKSGKYIVTLKAVPADKMEQLKELFKHTDEVPLEDMKGIFLTANIWEREDGSVPELPMKGEKVFCNIGFVQNREKTQRLLRVVGDIKLQPKTQLETVDMSAFFADEEAAVEMNTNVVASHDDVAQ